MRDNPAIRAVRWVLLALGLALPALTLVPLGSLWLWERGLLLYWAILACTTTVAAWALQRWLLAPAKRRLASGSDAVQPSGPGEATWTPAESKAWTRVQDIAQQTDPATIASRSDALALAQRTIEAVATTLHPERKDPLLQFTTPEALALVERVAARMNAFVRQSVPLGDKLTLAQMRTLYKWKGSIELAEQAWSVWRAIRLVNPAAALANEVRERVSKELITWGKSHVARRLTTVFVEEVGRAAIDLYGGRMRIAPEHLESYVSAESAKAMAANETEIAEPLRALVAGQVSAGKSSLVNALAQEVRAAVDALPATSRYTPYRLQREGLPAALIVDSPGIEPTGSLSEAFLAEAQRSDLVLWVVAASRADREADRKAIDAMRAGFAARLDRKPPPVLLVLTHIDRLRPFQDWSPPYDLSDTASPKAQSIRAAVEAAAGELGFSTRDVIPCSLAPGAVYNVDAIWAAITEHLPDAQRARLLRTLREAQGSWDAGKLWRQVVSGGRVLAGTLRGPN